MANILLPVRFTSENGIGHHRLQLAVALERTALVLVDCDGDCGPACNEVIHTHIAPALQAARAAGIVGIFIYNDGWLPDGVNSLSSELHGTRRGLPPHQESWRPVQPSWDASISPLAGEPLIGKNAQKSFVGTDLDGYLRARDIETLLLLGLSFKSCLFYTSVGAIERNYRVILLRDGTDPVGANEFADTVDSSLPEGGWVRLVLTRLIEDHHSYSSTCAELVECVRG